MYTGLATVVFFSLLGPLWVLSQPCRSCSCVVSCHVFMKLFYEQIKWWWWWLYAKSYIDIYSSLFTITARQFYCKLENVAIANSQQLEAARVMPVLTALITTPCRVWSSEPCCLHYVHYFTLWPWPLTFDLELLRYIACDVIKLCTKFERNRTIHGGVIAI